MLLSPTHQVVCGALVREGHVLLVHRSPNRSAYPNVWDLPGGHLESGESEMGALTRELHEELGVQISLDSVADLCRFQAGHGGDPVLLSAWLVGAWLGTPTNLALDEHDEIRWFGLEELPPLAHELVGTALVDARRDRAGS
jgi:8-oxo-dGTP pyrophosphatase MutT (NUDIX family)